MPGGLALAAIVVCAFFTSFTGGSGVTVLAMGGLLYPMLREDNHSRKFTSGLLTSSGSLGLLFPPSLAVLLYGIVAEIDIPTLFISGLVPGILEITLVAVFALLYSKRSGKTRVPFDAQKAARELWEAKWEVAIPFLVLGSIFSGLATLVETAAITVLYAFVLEFFIRRNLRLGQDLTRVVGSAATLIGGVLLILGVALGLTNFFVMQEIPSQATVWVLSFVESPLFFLLLLNLFLLVVGCLMDMYSAIVVVVPLIAPLGLLFGIDPFHLGIIFLTNLELGFLTPPVGMNLFLASYRFKRPLFEVYRSVLPFLAIRIVAVGLVTYVPALTTTLPKLWGR
jgi:tripartite ATP-independent transporter DctM subunit